MAEIVSGERTSGGMLPREADLAIEHDVSRGVARETIRALEERGLISVKHGIGATINGPDRWDVFDPDVIEVMLDSDRHDEVLRQHLECWHILMEAATGLAAERASTESATRIWEAFVRMEKQVDGHLGQITQEGFRDAEVAFYGELLDATGNPVLGAFVEKARSALLMAGYAPPGPRNEWGRAEYRKIAGAVASTNPSGAREAMRALLALAGEIEGKSLNVHG